MGMGPGMQGMMHQRMIMDNIPNLTDKQKKDIAVMRIDQQTEMKKMREDMQSKMKALRETQRTNIEKLLTPEQKKWLDENAPKPEATPKPQTTPAKTK
jgi:Spy/CpxP family protein refolding chaperone